MNRITIVIAALTLLSTSSIGHGQGSTSTKDLVTRPRPNLFPDVERSIPLLMSKGKVTGAQIAVIREGEPIWTKGFGYSNAEELSPNNVQTIFEAASLTKPLFGYTVMKMVQEGHIDLDKPVLKYLSTAEFEAFIGHSINAKGFRKEWADGITVRHILSHSAGMPHGEGGEVYPLLFEPGSDFKYSAAGYDLLQKVVEKITDKRLDVLIEEYVFVPFGMKNSSMTWNERFREKAANGHGMFGSPRRIRKYKEPNAMASLYTTAYDYALFVRGVMNSVGLSKELRDEFLAPQIDVEKNSGLSWSLGFGVQNDRNGKAIWQWGDYEVFRNFVVAYPDKQLALVYLSNSLNGLGIVNELAETIIGGQVLGVDYLGYGQYDTPMGQFCWSAMDNGVKAIDNQLPNLRAKYPQEFSSESIAWLGGEFVRVKRFDEGKALFRSNIEHDPTSSVSYIQLARAHFESGNINKAKQLYGKAREVGRNDKQFDRKTVEWAMSYIDALQKPYALPSDFLKDLAGTYEDRTFELRGDQLYYASRSKGPNDFRRLVPLSKDVFVLEGRLGLRFRFGLAEDGKPSKVSALYEWGYRDESTRNSE